jgi:hypothetical protein
MVVPVAGKDVVLVTEQVHGAREQRPCKEVGILRESVVRWEREVDRDFEQCVLILKPAHKQGIRLLISPDLLPKISTF